MKRRRRRRESAPENARFDATRGKYAHPERRSVLRRAAFAETCARRGWAHDGAALSACMWTLRALRLLQIIIETRGVCQRRALECDAMHGGARGESRPPVTSPPVPRRSSLVSRGRSRARASPDDRDGSVLRERWESPRSKPDKRASENARFRLCDRADAPVVTALGPRDVSTNGESQYTLFSSGVRFAATHRAVANAIEPSIHFI